MTSEAASLLVAPTLPLIFCTFLIETLCERAMVDGMNTLTKSLSWNEIVALEPQIRFIYEAARELKDDEKEDSFCATWHFHQPGGMKDQLKQYVGWSAADPRLVNEEAYDLVYRKIRNALPPCRNCNCC